MGKNRTILFNLDELEEGDLDKSGVYKITNCLNGDFYIGSSKNPIKNRMKDHSRQIDRMIHEKLITSSIFYNAVVKYGVENFKVSLEYESNDRTLILEKEEQLILTLCPKYNICKNPTKSGLPNKGRKLTEEWKNKIREQSSKYKHSEETLNKVIRNNKQNSCKLIFDNGNHSFNFDSWVIAANYFNVSFNNLINAYTRNGKWKNYKITKLSKQSKTIIVDNIEFNSFAECDRYFNMWRGYTSQCVKRKELILDVYDYYVKI